MSFCFLQAAAASMVQVPGNVRFQVPVKTFVDLKFRHVVRQAYDLSCGAAAVATLLRFYYGDDAAERQIIESIFEFGDKEKIQKDGFSMLELKRYGERRGYVVQGFRIPKVESLPKLKVPVITLINTRGYNHFVVIKGVKDGRVYVADPAFGNSAKPLDGFGNIWSNVILVYLSPTNGGNEEFRYDAVLRAPVETVMWTLDRVGYGIRPGANEF